MKMVSAALSKAGSREINQESSGCLVRRGGLGLWSLASGESEGGWGGVLAQQAIKSLEAAFSGNPAANREVLSSIITSAQMEMLQLKYQWEEYKTARVALALFCTGGQWAFWGHLGDARVYVFREGALLNQTKDHTAAQILVEAGKISALQLQSHADRHRLLRFLGSPGMVSPTLLEQRFAMQPGDVFLLCSGGFWEHVCGWEMLADWCKSANLKDWLERMEMRLLQKAPADHGNYTAVALLAEAPS